MGNTVTFKRKPYLDNIRWITVWIVIVYHIIYLFNCSGVLSNIHTQGIPQLDFFLTFVYPWFMNLLFVVAGMSSRFSLNKRTNKEFIKDRLHRLLIPSLISPFVYGWTSMYIDNLQTGAFNEIPSAGIKYLIYALAGVGPLWFAHVAFVASLVLLLARKLDKKDKFYDLCGKTNYTVLALLVIGVWVSSLILNTPVIVFYHWGLYLFMFLLGYFVFSHDEVIQKLEKICIPMGVIAFVIGVCYSIFYYGKNYGDTEVLKNPFTGLYTWVSVLAILGLGSKFLNFSNKFTEYMSKNNFSFYVLHYSIELIMSYTVITYLNLPFALNYILILIGSILILLILNEILKRIPVVNRLLLGIINKRDKKINKSQQV